MATHEPLRAMKRGIYRLLDGEFGQLSQEQEDAVLRLKSDLEYLEAFASAVDPLLTNHAFRRPGPSTASSFMTAYHRKVRRQTLTRTANGAPLGSPVPRM